MSFDMLILGPVRPVVAVWLARLADRVADLREQARLGVIEAVGRTTAEAVEWLLHAALGPIRSMEMTPTDPDGFDDFDADDVPRPRAVPPRPSWCWRAAVAAALHAAGGWVRNWAPPPVAAVAAALIGAVAVLLE